MSDKRETKHDVRNWTFGAMLVTLGFMLLLHLQVTRLLPEQAKALYVLNEKILPLSWDMRYLFRALFIFACAYGSVSASVVFRKINPYGIYYFVVASLMLLYGYMVDLEWYNAFIFPFLPFVVMLNAKHLPKMAFDRKRKEDFYNHYNHKQQKGGVLFKLQKKRLKSEVKELADFSQPLSLMEPAETTYLEAGTGKGKSRGALTHPIDTFIKEGYNIVFHEFKGNPHHHLGLEPELTKFAWASVKRQKKEYDLNMMGFTDPVFTKRGNIYDPFAIKNEQDVLSVNQNLMYSLNKSWAKDSGTADPFWKDNAISLINGVSLVAAKYRPSNLTLPHLVAMLVRDADELLDAFMNVPDMHIRTHFQAFKNAYATAKETAGSIISSAQIPLVKLNDPVMFWALSGKEGMDSFFPLDFRADKPFILSVCNNANFPIHSVGVNCYLKSIMSRLRTSANRPTALILDEFDQMFIDAIDGAIATVRSAGTMIIIVLQTYKQLEDRMGKSYAEKIWDLCQNKIFGGGGSAESIKKFVDSYVPKYQDLEQSVGESDNNDGNTGLRTADKKVVEVNEVLGQEKFHFSGVLSTGEPNTFFNLPFKVNETDLSTIDLPTMNQHFVDKQAQFKAMMKMKADGQEVNVSEQEAKAAFDKYVESAMEENRDRIFMEAGAFIEDLKHGTL